MVTLRQLVLFGLAAAVFSGCAWSQPPAEHQALAASYEISTDAKKPSLGKLLLTEQGLWGFVHARAAKEAPTFSRGELVAFLPHEGNAPAHLFGVVAERSWGVMLQRLDGRTIAFDTVRGDLVPVRSEAQLERWGICHGAGGNLADDACLGAAGRTVAWRVYGANAKHRLSVAEDDNALVLPIRTDGVVHAGRAVVRADSLERGWVAVPVRANRATVPHARVLLDTQCPDIDLTRSIQPIEILRGTVDASEHPVEIEEAAIAAGADALVRCASEEVTVQVPMLFRPRLQVTNTSASGVPYGAMRPWSFAKENRAAVESAVLLAASLSTGAGVAADFYLERTLLAAPETKTAGRLALELMQVAAAAGRPEAALRGGRAATSEAWHRQNRPAFVLGKAWVLAALGQTRSYAEAMTRVSKLAKEPANRQARLWLAWSQLRDDAGTSAKQSITRAMSVLEKSNAPKWLEAGELLVGWITSGQNTLTAPKTRLSEAFQPFDAGCEDVSTCKLDVYGRNFAALVEASSADDGAQLVEQLQSTAVAAIRPGFRLSTLDAGKLGAADSVAMRAAAMPLLSPGLREDGFRELVEDVAGAWRESGRCLEVEQTDVLVARLGDARRDHAGQAALAATRWLLAGALPSACESPRKFIQSLERGLIRYPKITTYAAPLLEALTSRASKEDRLVLLREFGDFTAEHEKGAACKRWNLALAVSSANAGRLDEAEKELTRAINCEATGEDAYEATELLIIGFLQFERSAVVPSDLSAGARARLAALVRREPVVDRVDEVCTGLLPLEYNLSRYVHPNIAALAVAMPELPTDELALETSSRSASRGIASLLVARRNLGEGRPRLAAKALAESRQAFARIDHKVGLRRVAFLESVIFGGDLEAYLEGEDKTERSVSLDSPDKLDAGEWARALMAGKAREILAAVAVDGAQLDDEAKRAALAASLIVDSEEQTVEKWRSNAGGAHLADLCGRDE
ncbi:hypothetical protein FIV42_28740 [Persicimonas caeni]|uniref:Tetratricopeptide repeat protein n=1 Tax=Persicimonas caeni TaxID=2292766 RepID=A0A4Y6Q284_PERCE|nr:hypothetical protein [Persicimonas caeni]QDG54589.1 hypothetical protein FIV42_28740 [Persicimonas caeni]QED35810.1 hypothetical protein FRD00_28735 [Persicimonas caeni]